MGKTKLGNVMWSMMFQIDTDRERDIWEILHKFDREKPEAFCEWAADDWYDWHGFLSRNSLRKAIPLVFEAFPEVNCIEIYKERMDGDYVVKPELRETIYR